MKHLFTTLFIFTLLTSPFTLQSHAATIQLPKTGQTTSYATGDDGDLEIGLAWPNPRFTDNGDQTMTDMLSGLIWSKNANPADATKTLQQALDYIKTHNSQNYQGHNDWRLPNINELKSLVNQGQSSPVTWLNSQGFSNVRSNGYWSSSTYASGTTYAWNVDMYVGLVGYGSLKISSNYVWPVRSGQSGSFNNLTLSKSGTGIGPWSWTCTGSNGGTTATCNAIIKTWAINSGNGSNGTVNCTTPVNNGATSTCTVTPTTGYQLYPPLPTTALTRSHS